MKNIVYWSANLILVAWFYFLLNMILLNIILVINLKIMPEMFSLKNVFINLFTIFNNTFGVLIFIRLTMNFNLEPVKIAYKKLLSYKIISSVSRYITYRTYLIIGITLCFLLLIEIATQNLLFNDFTLVNGILHYLVQIVICISWFLYNDKNQIRLAFTCLFLFGFNYVILSALPFFIMLIAFIF